MSKNKLELLVGIILIVLPFLGFPSLWRLAAAAVLGLVLIVSAFMSHIRRRSSQTNIYNE